MLFYEYFQKYLLQYQLKDLLPNLFITVIMGIIVSLMNNINMTRGYLLILQIIAGIIIYLSLSILTKNENLTYLIEYIKLYIKRGKKDVQEN